jgi:hypothetical protein
MAPTLKVSPALQDRLDRLETCSGHWLLIRDGEPERDCHYQWHHTPAEHLTTCLAERWRGVSLGFVPSWIGYSDYGNTGLVGLSNFRTFTDTASTPDPHGAVLEIGYGWNGRGVAVDVRYVTDNQLETIEALEAYPLISEDDHSELEWEAVGSDWGGESIADRVRTLQQLGLSVFAARDAAAPWRDGFDRLRDYILENLNEYPTATI